MKRMEKRADSVIGTTPPRERGQRASESQVRGQRPPANYRGIYSQSAELVRSEVRECSFRRRGLVILGRRRRSFGCWRVLSFGECSLLAAGRTIAACHLYKDKHRALLKTSIARLRPALLAIGIGSGFPATAALTKKYSREKKETSSKLLDANYSTRSLHTQHT